MSRHRDRREARALAYLKRHRFASALDIGSAAVEGEPRSGRIPQHGRESIGLAIAISLVRRHKLQATNRNTFQIPPRL